MKYKIVILNKGKALCAIEISELNSEESLATVLDRFPEDEGFSREILGASTEKRLLESSREGVKVLSCTPDYEPINQL